HRRRRRLARRGRLAARRGRRVPGATEHLAVDAHDRCGRSRATGGDTVTTALVIGRLRPGRPIRETVGETQRLLEAAGWKVETSLVKKKRSVRKRTAAAAKDGVDVVVAVGGDGVVLQVVQSLA